MGAAGAGPLVASCPSVHASELPRGPDGALRLWHLVAGRQEPLVVRGAFSDSAAVQRWSFEELASRCAAVDAAGSGGRQLAQNGLIEQGTTRAAQAVVPSEYMSALARGEAAAPAAGLLPHGSTAAAAAAAGELVSLDWSAISASRAAPVKQYLAHWDMCGYVEACKREGAPIAASVWPRGTLSWDFCWAGPAGTVTGLHFDRPNNWFTQVRGVKELVLFPQSEAQRLPLTDKYDPGARLCAVDVTRLAGAASDADVAAGEAGDSAAAARARAAALMRTAVGWHVRLEAGDTLFVPKRTFHMVVALSPSLSISSFGHAPRELVTTGVSIAVLDALHGAGLHRWGACSCHGADMRRPWVPIVVAAAAAAVACWGGLRLLGRRC